MRCRYTLCPPISPFSFCKEYAECIACMKFSAQHSHTLDRLMSSLMEEVSRHLSIYLSTYLWLYDPLLDLGRSFSFLFLYTVGRTPWTANQPVARPLPTHRTPQTQNKCIHRHPCLEWNSNPRSRRSSERRQFMLRQCGHYDQHSKQ
jgi:hypothetical protein